MSNNDYAYIDSLVEKVQNNDLDAFWELFSFYEPIIVSCVKSVHSKYNTIDSDDIYSESIFVFKDLCLKYNKNRSYFSYFIGTRIQPYLITRIKTKYLNKFHQISLDDVNNVEPLVYLGDYEDFIVLRDALDKLNDEQKLAIQLLYFERMTQKECAKILKISQPAFNKKIKKILGILKENMK